MQTEKEQGKQQEEIKKETITKELQKDENEGENQEKR